MRSDRKCAAMSIKARVCRELSGCGIQKRRRMLHTYKIRVEVKVWKYETQVQVTNTSYKALAAVQRTVDAVYNNMIITMTMLCQTE